MKFLQNNTLVSPQYDIHCNIKNKQTWKKAQPTLLNKEHYKMHNKVP